MSAGGTTPDSPAAVRGPTSKGRRGREEKGKRGKGVKQKGGEGGRERREFGPPTFKLFPPPVYTSIVLCEVQLCLNPALAEYRILFYISLR